MKKMIRYGIILILVLCSFSLIPSGSCGFHNGYTVEPVTPDMDTGTPLETVPVDFWDLPPGMMLLALALSVSSFIGFPVELFLFIKLYAYLGYRNVTRSIVFHNNTRNLAYRYIQDYPGIYFNYLVRMTGIKPGTLRYHLIILMTTGKISAMNTNGHTRYFENSRKFSEVEKTVFKHIRNETDNRILILLLDNPDTNRKNLEVMMGISGPLVTWYMRRLSDDGIVSIQKNRKNVRYEIYPEVRQYLEKYLVPNRGVMPVLSLEPSPESS
ncbi:winged helix-turn-helix transcriptional regulator [Methanoregula formicica]|nr:winged helix-turn-helix transcriptional regulator [Methanoregula formicica]